MPQHLLALLDKPALGGVEEARLLTELGEAGEEPLLVALFPVPERLARGLALGFADGVFFFLGQVLGKGHPRARWNFLRRCRQRRRPAPPPPVLAVAMAAVGLFAVAVAIVRSDVISKHRDGARKGGQRAAHV